jgi:TonB family protein
VAPSLSTVIAFTLDPAGSLLDAHVKTSSLSGSADTSVLAAVQGAATTHAFPAISTPPPGRQPLRFDVAVTTMTPDPAQQVAVLDQIDVADYRLARPVELIPGSYADLMATKSSPTGPPDSAVFEMVVDENGKAVMSTVRAYTQAGGRAGDQSYRGFVARIANLLPFFRFDPAMIGTCHVRQITLQPFAN